MRLPNLPILGLNFEWYFTLSVAPLVSWTDRIDHNQAAGLRARGFRA